MKPKVLLTSLAAALLSASAAFAQVTLATWTFESSQPAGTPGAGVWFTNVAAEAGSGTASGLHAGNAVYSTPVGNGSAHAFSSTLWAVGDFYQFAVSTTNVQGISVSFDQVSSGTGPGQFYLAYSTDGVNFTQFGDVYTVLSSPSWSSTSPKTGESYSFDLSSVSSLNNAAVVYFRVVVASTTSANGGTIGTGGTSRIDNVAVSASGSISVSGPPTIFSEVQSTNVYAGRTVGLKIVAAGSEPLSYRWYHPDLNTPLSDNGVISGTTSAELTISPVSTNEAGNYQVIVSNDFGAVTSAVAHLTVKMPIATNIAYLRTLQDSVNWTPTDTTNLYTVRGTVTTYVRMTGVGNSEFFIQDGTAGIAVFVSGGSSVPDAGSVVEVTGPLGQFNGLLELNLNAGNPDHSITLISGGNPLPTPKLFTFSSAADIPYMEATEGSLVVVSNVFLGSTNGFFVASGGVTMTNLSGQTFTLFINANESDVIGQPVPQFAASIAGVMGQFKSSAPYTSGYELDITQFADLVVGTPPSQPLPIALKIQLSGGNVVLTWDEPTFNLQTATDMNGPFTDVPGATSPYTNNVGGPVNFYRLIH